MIRFHPSVIRITPDDVRLLTEKLEKQRRKGHSQPRSLVYGMRSVFQSTTTSAIPRIQRGPARSRDDAIVYSDDPYQHASSVASSETNDMLEETQHEVDTKDYAREESPVRPSTTDSISPPHDAVTSSPDSTDRTTGGNQPELVLTEALRDDRKRNISIGSDEPLIDMFDQHMVINTSLRQNSGHTTEGIARRDSVLDEVVPQLPLSDNDSSAGESQFVSEDRYHTVGNLDGGLTQDDSNNCSDGVESMTNPTPAIMVRRRRAKRLPDEEPLQAHVSGDSTVHHARHLSLPNLATSSLSEDVMSQAETLISDTSASAVLQAASGTASPLYEFQTMALQSLQTLSRRMTPPRTESPRRLGDGHAIASRYPSTSAMSMEGSPDTQITPVRSRSMAGVVAVSSVPFTQRSHRHHMLQAEDWYDHRAPWTWRSPQAAANDAVRQDHRQQHLAGESLQHSRYRRPAPSADQENGDELELRRFHDERWNWWIRQRGSSSGGMMETTPPREGELERFLR